MRSVNILKVMYEVTLRFGEKFSKISDVDSAHVNARDRVLFFKKNGEEHYVPFECTTGFSVKPVD